MKSKEITKNAALGLLAGLGWTILYFLWLALYNRVMHGQVTVNQILDSSFVGHPSLFFIGFVCLVMLIVTAVAMLQDKITLYHDYTRTFAVWKIKKILHIMVRELDGELWETIKDLKSQEFNYYVIDVSRFEEPDADGTLLNIAYRLYVKHGAFVLAVGVKIEDENHPFHILCYDNLDQVEEFLNTPGGSK